MKEAFLQKRFQLSSLILIEEANNIIEEYRKRRFILTLRQLYYQFVARGILENSVKNYKKLGSVVNDARLAGHIDWSAIEDRTRNLKSLPSWNSPQDILDSAIYGYHLNRWKDQKNYVEVWIEKEALAGVIERICNTLDIPFFACRGYVSQSEQYNAGKRLLSIAKHRAVTVLHLGDHDPSGIDMTRDNDDRLSMFAEGGVYLRRIALNMDQVEEYNPPPNPAKTTDTRYESYINEYGEESWELDALDPDVLEATDTFTC